MAILIDYIWQSTFGLLVFYGVYLVLLKKQKAFNVSRAYLILSPIIALICPLINIPVEFEKPGISLNQTEFFRALSEQEAPEVFVASYGLPEVTVHSTKLPIILEIKDYLFLAYIFVATVLLTRLIWGLAQIRALYQRGWFQAHYDSINKCLVVPTFGKSPVFSFFNSLFWDDTADLEPQEKEMIYGHELVHIRQRHSWDVVYFQVLSVLFWFNPFIHLMRLAITELHEYLADDQMVKRNDETNSYIKLIAAQAIRGIEFSVGSHFAKSLTLSRIQMIKNGKNISLIKLIAILPITVLLMGLISLRAPDDIRQMPDRLTSTIDVIKQKLLVSKDSLTIGINMKKLTDPQHFEYISELEGQKIVAQIGMFEYAFDGIRSEGDYRKVRQLIDRLRENSLLPLDDEILRPHGPIDRRAYFPGKPGEWEERVLDMVNLPDWELKMGLGGVIEIEFVVERDGRIADPIIKRSIGGGLDSQFLDALLDSNLPRWKPAIYKNTPVKSVQSVSFGFYPSSY
ncbi:putative transcriptional regulator [Mariniradius saccharolyticus AK6]|uniref:Transcriptional regulator n=1 Tax=Mariniradius saccharolyticus AK6 TaxID=1239962 RepID=M7XAN5_9BACT|nr:M56 family metallopeptidase [Mariniradius saccharolyticus]EMS31954.1 putative transcriptional regulator [Mariniradius saccharolyticus AK6]